MYRASKWEGAVIEVILTFLFLSFFIDNKHRQHVVFGENLQPFIAQNSFVAPCATLVGMVEVWHEASIWYRVTIKGALFNHF